MCTAAYIATGPRKSLNRQVSDLMHTLAIQKVLSRPDHRKQVVHDSVDVDWTDEEAVF